MILKNFDYINIPEWVLNIATNAEKLLCENGKSKTYEHVLSVAKTCVEIGYRYNLNKEKCFLCGLLHDISAVIKPEDMLLYAKSHDMKVYDAEKKYPSLLHQRISTIVAREHFGIDDNDILSAIECHTTLKANPSSYDMALFIADKLSWDQDGTPPFYDEVSRGLDTSLAYIDFMLNNGRILYPHDWLLQAKEFLNLHT